VKAKESGEVLFDYILREQMRMLLLVNGVECPLHEQARGAVFRSAPDAEEVPMALFYGQPCPSAG
jgi:hypothetical protein